MCPSMDAKSFIRTTLVVWREHCKTMLPREGAFCFHAVAYELSAACNTEKAHLTRKTNSRERLVVRFVQRVLW